MIEINKTTFDYDPESQVNISEPIVDFGFGSAARGLPNGEAKVIIVGAGAEKALELIKKALKDAGVAGQVVDESTISVNQIGKDSHHAAMADFARRMASPLVHNFPEVWPGSVKLIEESEVHIRLTEEGARLVNLANVPAVILTDISGDFDDRTIYPMVDDRIRPNNNPSYRDLVTRRGKGKNRRF